jgi:hypothetical protein
LEATVVLSLISEWVFSAVYPVVPVKSAALGAQEVTWNVLAKPDGTMTESATDLEVAYLFWEARYAFTLPLSSITDKPHL